MVLRKMALCVAPEHDVSVGVPPSFTKVPATPGVPHAIGCCFLTLIEQHVDRVRYDLKVLSLKPLEHPAH